MIKSINGCWCDSEHKSLSRFPSQSALFSNSGGFLTCCFSFCHRKNTAKNAHLCLGVLKKYFLKPLNTSPSRQQDSFKARGRATNRKTHFLFSLSNHSSAR